MTTSFVAACASGRSTSDIPAVPAAWFVTTIALLARLPASSPRLHGCRSTACPRTDYRTNTDRWDLGRAHLDADQSQASARCGPCVTHGVDSDQTSHSS